MNDRLLAEKLKRDLIVRNVSNVWRKESYWRYSGQFAYFCLFLQKPQCTTKQKHVKLYPETLKFAVQIKHNQLKHNQVWCLQPILILTTKRNLVKIDRITNLDRFEKKTSIKRKTDDTNYAAGKM